MDIEDSRRVFSRKRWYHPRCKGENGKWTLGESSQSVYPLELSCDRSTNQQTLDRLTPIFRLIRDAAVAARSRIQEVTEIESEEQV